MKSSWVPLVIFYLSATACRNVSDSGVEDTSPVREFPPDGEVMAKAYDGSFQVPDYFFKDERADTPQSYTVYHVKDISVSYELCTDDFVEAAALEAEDNDSRAVNGELVGHYENARYFEFIRDLSYPDGAGNISDPTSPGFSRVFKCSYLNRDGVDRTLRDGYAGMLFERPLSTDAAKTFTEYMWQFTFFWPARKTVLESFSSETDEAYQHTLLLALLTNRGFERCDLIEVVDWVFSIDKGTGQLTKAFQHLYQLEAKLVNNFPEKCGV